MFRNPWVLFFFLVNLSFITEISAKNSWRENHFSFLTMGSFINSYFPDQKNFLKILFILVRAQVGEGQEAGENLKQKFLRPFPPSCPSSSSEGPLERVLTSNGSCASNQTVHVLSRLNPNRRRSQMASHDTTGGPCPRAFSRPQPNHHITADFRHSSGAVKSNRF